jgi:putative oxidoreductase
MKSLERILTTNAPASVVLIRLVVGAIFLSEGIQKFLFANDLGVGRFIRLGFPRRK